VAAPGAWLGISAVGKADEPEPDEIYQRYLGIDA
jgi:hypothetical protein